MAVAEVARRFASWREQTKSKFIGRVKLVKAEINLLFGG